MKKIILFVVIISILFIPEVSHALNTEGPIRKLGRGIANALTCPLEMIKCVGDTNYNDGPVAAMSLGFVKGIFNTCVRGAIGVYEIVTFLLPFPENYEPILTDPEFFLSEGWL